MVLTPPKPLRPGGVRSSLCLALPDGYRPADDDEDGGYGARAPTGAVVHARAIFRTTTGETREYGMPDYEFRGAERRLRLCFVVRASEVPPLQFAAVALSADGVLPVERIEWSVIRWGSL